ncbi:hypothetical protein Bca4012_074679 [Brassica carinata]
MARRRQRAGDSRTEHNSCSVLSVVMRRLSDGGQHSGGRRRMLGLRLEADELGL